MREQALLCETPNYNQLLQWKMSYMSTTPRTDQLLHCNYFSECFFMDIKLTVCPHVHCFLLNYSNNWKCYLTLALNRCMREPWLEWTRVTWIDKHLPCRRKPQELNSGPTTDNQGPYASRHNVKLQITNQMLPWKMSYMGTNPRTDQLLQYNYFSKWFSLYIDLTVHPHVHCFYQTIAAIGNASWRVECYGAC